MTNYIHILRETTGHEALVDLLMSGPNPDSPLAAEEPAKSAPARSALPADRLWERYEPYDVTHLTDDGDLVLDVRSLFASNGFLEGFFLDAWAHAHRFDTSGWDEYDVLWTMLHATLIPAVSDFDSGLIEAFEASLGDAAFDVPDLPSFRIIVDGKALMTHLVTQIDGRFTSDDDLAAAIESRILPSMS